MPELVNPTEDVGALALTALAVGLQIKRGTGAYETVLSADDTNGNVTLAPGSDVGAVVQLIGPTRLNGITYTWPAAQAAGQVLQTNGAGALSWAMMTSTLAGQTDVAITTPLDGQVLRYNAATTKWINSTTLKVVSGVVTIGTDPGGAEALRVGGGIRASTVSTFLAGITVSGAASSMNRASSGQTILNMSVVGDPFGRLNMFSDGSFSMGTGAATPDVTFGRIGAGNVRMTGGTDGSSTWTIGQGGSAPTTGRTAKLVLNAPSSGTFVGQTLIQYQLDGATKWQTGTTTDAVSGARLATTDYAWHNGTSYVAGLSTAGVLVLAGGLIVGTDPGGTELVRIGGGLRASTTITAGTVFNALGTNAAPTVAVFGSQTTATLPYTTFTAQLNRAIEVTANAVPGAGGPAILLSNLDVGSGASLGGISFVASGTPAGEKRGAAIISTLTASAAATVSADLRFYVTSASVIAQAMAINTDKTVIIGTDPGGSQLVRVGGDLTVSGKYYGKRALGTIMPVIAFWDEVGTDALGGSVGNALAIGNYGGANLYLVTNDLTRVKIEGGGAVVIGTDPGGTQLLRVGGALNMAGALTASSSGSVATFTTSTIAVAAVRVISSSTSNGAALSLENSSGTTGMRNYTFVINYNINGALEMRVSTAVGGDPLTAGGTALTLTPGKGVRIGDGSVLAVGATDGFLHIPPIAAAPTGTPLLFGGSSLPTAYSYTAKRLWIYNSANAAWDFVQFT